MAQTPRNRPSSILAVSLPLLLIWFILALVMPRDGNIEGADSFFIPASLQDGHEKVVYASDNLSTYDLWIIDNWDQPEPQVVFRNDESEEREPVWSPDGSTIAFVSDRLSESFDLFIKPPNQAPRPLTRTGGLNERHPAWSPDGHRLVFVAERTTDVWDLYIIDSDGSNRSILRNTILRDEFDPDWHPDGTRIVFARGGVLASNKTDLYIIDTRGTEEPTQLTDTSELDEREPRWSPDGLHILFTRGIWRVDKDFPDEADIWVMNADGTGETNLTENMSGKQFNPSWSPDGEHILFTSDRDVQLDLFVMPAGGGEAQLVEIPRRQSQNELEADWWGPREEPPTPGPSPTATNTPTPTLTSTPTTTPTATPTATATPSPTSTPTPTSTPYPDLSTSTKHVNTGSALPGELLIYTITLVNSGTRIADQVRVTDPVPSEVEYTGVATATVGTPLWDSINKQVTWTGPVGLEDQVIIRFQARVKPGVVEGTTILNRVNIFYSGKVHTKSTQTLVGRTKVYLPLVARNRDGCLDINLSEPNNTIGTANGPLCPDHSYHAYIESDDDQDDLYWTRVSPGGTLVVELTSIPLGTDYDLAVYDEQVTKIGESANGGNDNERVEVPVIEGKYYIRVHRFQGSSELDPYELTWRLTQ